MDCGERARIQLATVAGTLGICMHSSMSRSSWDSFEGGAPARRVDSLDACLLLSRCKSTE